MPTAFENFVNQIPHEKEVQLPMVADSTAETAIQIDTDIKQGSKVGWAIYGMTYLFQDIASPHARRDLGQDDTVVVVQLCRGDVPSTPILLSRGDSDLLLEDCLSVVQASGVGHRLDYWPRRVSKLCYTQLPHMYLMMQSTPNDCTGLSATTIELFAQIHYMPMVAPKAPVERV